MAEKNVCRACGSDQLGAFSGKTLSIDGQSSVSGLAGLQCAVCGEVFLDAKSQDKYIEACDAAVLAEREREQQELIRIRKKLKLTQHQAAQLTGGGP